MRVALHDIAHSRAGDKGQLVTLSLVAYNPAWYPVLRDAVRPDRVWAHLSERVTGNVTRHELPGLGTLMFVCSRSTTDSVTTSLHIDGHGKTMSSALLEMEIDVPDDLARQLSLAVAPAPSPQPMWPRTMTQLAESDVRQWTISHGPSAESVFAWESLPVRFGLGATNEMGHELRRLGVRRALIVTDAGLAGTGMPERVRELALAASVDAQIWSGVDVEPTDKSIRRAVAELKDGSFDGFVGLGGGSSLDTCKAINLLLSHGGELESFIGAPHGGGRAVPGPLRPMIGIPTTAGTGSECSAVAIINLTDMRVKGAISDPRIRPALAIVDPLNTLSGPSWVTASAGYDALVQTLESYTSRPFNQRDRQPEGAQRPLYSGSTPISDLWNEKALGLMGKYLRRAVLDPEDLDARTGMALGALFSRMGTAGAHIPHAAAYAIAGLVRSYRPVPFGPGPALVPHGMSVVVTAASAFDRTYSGAPGRHDRAVHLVTQGAGVDCPPSEALGTWLRQLVESTDGPRGLEEFGFAEADIPELTVSTLTHARLLTGAPCPVGPESLGAIFQASFSR